MKKANISSYELSMNICKANLREAEDKYAQALEEYTRHEIYGSLTMDSEDYEYFMYQKCELVSEYLNGMWRLEIKENLLNYHHYLEQFIDLKKMGVDLPHTYEGNKEHGLEILKGIQSMEIQRPFYFGCSQDELN